MDIGGRFYPDVPPQEGSEPGFRRPVLVVQSDAFNRSRIRTVVAVVLTANMRLVDAPGIVLPSGASGFDIHAGLRLVLAL